MKTALNEYLKDLSQLFFPNYCLGCGAQLPSRDLVICIKCLSQLPETGFNNISGNKMEKYFYGRLKIEEAVSAYYYTEDSLIQHLIFEMKYFGNKDAGLLLGSLLANIIVHSNSRFKNIDLLIPVPLNERREKMRGFNQSALIAHSISKIMGVPVLENVVIRNVYTETQTKKNRANRWQNIESAFRLKQPDHVRNKHVLLVDDVVTTGATLDACGSVLLQADQVKLSLATVAIATF